MKETPPPPIAPSFETTDDLKTAWHDKHEHSAGRTYARDGYPRLREREQEIAEMIPGAVGVVLFNAGMAAIETVVEAEGLRPGDVVLCGQDMYGRTKGIAASLKTRGVKVVPIDSGDMEAIARAIETEKPRLIILEAVANAMSMRVCDIGKLAELAEQATERYGNECNPTALLEKYLETRTYAERFSAEDRKGILAQVEIFKKESNPMVFRDAARALETAANFTPNEAVRETVRLAKYILRGERESLMLVLDNTLSSPVLRNPLAEAGNRDVHVVGVESGTKHYQGGVDMVTLGVAYTNDKETLDTITEERAKIGTYLQPMDEALLPDQLAATMRETVRRQATNALALATYLEGKPGIREVSHPNLPTHEDHELAGRLAPEGLVTLFYIAVDDPMGFVDKVKAVAGDVIEIGVSFGHEKTRLLPHSKNGDVRIAAGSEDEAGFARVMESFKIALADNQ